MKFKEEDVKLYELYSVLGTEYTKEDEENVKLLESEILKEGVNCSRIHFKEFRDQLAKPHQGYALENHNGDSDEDYYTKEMYRIDRLGKDGKVDYGIGRIVDYEVPFKNGGDSSIEIGTINLIAETALKLYLINAKEKDSGESLLRAVLETVTKFNMVSRRKLFESYNTTNTNAFKYNHSKENIFPALMIFEGSRPHNDFLQIDPSGLVGKLVYKYHIKFFIIKKQADENVYELKD